MDQALRALNRFGLGAGIGERQGLKDPRGWLSAQLEHPDAARMPAPEGATPETLAAMTARLREAQRADDRDALRRARRELDAALGAERAAALGRRVGTETPFLERLVAFWSNHLCVSAAAKQQVVPFAGAYEREVVRPHVLGRFADMVLASARHPAMLLYLDNFTSIGPTSPAARLAARRGRGARGLNENYARELMELHTIGVDGGYTQADVEALARVLTGWTLDGLGEATSGPRAYRFRPALHEPGEKVVLGRRYAQGGEREGEAAVRDLCAHPSTARFLATKLVRHFVSDDPPAAAVARIADTYERSGGDLHAVSSALVELDEAWAPDARKLRAPQDWLVAALRAVHAHDAAPALVAILRQLRHPLWAPEAPKGFGDEARDWADPDGLMNRAELARTIAARIARSGMAPERLLDVVDVPAGDPLRGMVSDRSIPVAERVALVLGGPAFQWR